MVGVGFLLGIKAGHFLFPNSYASDVSPCAGQCMVPKWKTDLRGDGPVQIPARRRLREVPPN